MCSLVSGVSFVKVCSSWKILRFLSEARVGSYSVRLCQCSNYVHGSQSMPGSSLVLTVHHFAKIAGTKGAALAASPT